MPGFELFETEPFSKLFKSLDKRGQAWIVKIKTQLKINPFGGKPLHFEWFREKKFEGKRLYFLVSEKNKKILLLAFGSKKDQQKIIDHILFNKEDYWRIVEKL